MNRSVESIGLTVALLLFIAGEGVVLFFAADSYLRLVLGLLIVGPIIFSASRLGVVDHFLMVVSPTFHARPQSRMRTLVNQLLEEVRRLNATAKDGRLGVRGPEETAELMDSLESGLRGLVERIRDVAGEESPRRDDEFEEAHPPAGRP